MANFLDFVTPTGQKGNVAKPSTLVPIVLGGIVFLAGISAAEAIGKKITGRVPFINTMPAPPFGQNVTTISSSPQQQYIG